MNHDEAKKKVQMLLDGAIKNGYFEGAAPVLDMQAAIEVLSNTLPTKPGEPENTESK